MSVNQSEYTLSERYRLGELGEGDQSIDIFREREGINDTGKLLHITQRWLLWIYYNVM